MKGLKPYVDRVVEGEKDILWPGQTTLLCQKQAEQLREQNTSPITKESIKNTYKIQLEMRF